MQPAELRSAEEVFHPTGVTGTDKPLNYKYTHNMVKVHFDETG